MTDSRQKKQHSIAKIEHRMNTIRDVDDLLENILADASLKSSLQSFKYRNDRPCVL